MLKSVFEISKRISYNIMSSRNVCRKDIIMGEIIKVELNGQLVEAIKGISLYDLSKEYGKSNNLIVAAKVDNQLKELRYILECDSKVEFLDLSNDDGMRIYVRSLTLLLVRAAKEILNGVEIIVEHSIGQSLYCEAFFDRQINEKDINAIKQRMTEIISADEEIQKTVLPKEQALELFKDKGDIGKYNVIKHRQKDTANIYTSGWYTDYFYGYMVHRTGYLKWFDLKAYEKGMVLMFPDKSNPTRVAPFRDISKLFKVYHENQHWGKILQVGDVGDLDELIEAGQGGDLIRVAEALQEKRIANIADNIINSENKIRIVLIAGPSSSGKTTFAKRLSIQLRVNGIRPVAISLDDYFVDRENTPLDEEGDPDFESIEALDLKLFNEHLIALLSGQEAEIPIYNFKKGSREPQGNKMKIDSDQIIIIEGIHGLNERLTAAIPRENKFKIYTSALTQIRLDDHNRIPTTDARIIRRIVRDFQFRGYSALGTIKMWPKVRRGEEKNIFPFQEEADAMFNSSLVYELSVLRNIAIPLLDEIGIENPEYSEAKRLKDFLSYFLPLDPKDVLQTSIIREFIGGSCFYE